MEIAGDDCFLVAESKSPNAKRDPRLMTRCKLMSERIEGLGKKITGRLQFVKPLIFRFEDEEPLPPEKEDWEKRIEDLFGEMDMCNLESHIGFTNPSVSPMQSE
ncbi:hypothetical protein HAX54_035373, partial [Datura stramonium]|nr:hypothetical protein [Datura stramonium]